MNEPDDFTEMYMHADIHRLRGKAGVPYLSDCGWCNMPLAEEPEVRYEPSPVTLTLSGPDGLAMRIYLSPDNDGHFFKFEYPLPPIMEGSVQWAK